MWVGVPEALPIPVTVMEYGPGAVPAAVVTCMVRAPPEVTDEGVNDTVAPDGKSGGGQGHRLRSVGGGGDDAGGGRTARPPRWPTAARRRW